jgi:hypothetical protein
MSHVPAPGRLHHLDVAGGGVVDEEAQAADLADGSLATLVP